MNFLAGVDEAGLGPILGPLVVAGIAMQGPEGKDPWRALKSHVCRHKSEKGKVRVADSKKVNQGPHGLLRLEETALVFWGAKNGALPPNLGAWLVALGADLELLQRCPWYEDLSLPLPFVADRGVVELRAELVARAPAKTELAIVDIAVRPVDVEEWNTWIADTDNKSRAHFQAYAEVLGRILRSVPPAAEGERRQLVADRCGGRMHYAQDLRQLCPSARVDVVQEEPACSTYVVRDKGGATTVTFAERAEDRAFPTALASCFAKYLRELMVETLNRWFVARVPGLSPTAGYYVDGRRFLDDVKAHVDAMALPRHRLVRVR